MGPDRHRRFGRRRRARTTTTWCPLALWLGSVALIGCGGGTTRGGGTTGQPSPATYGISGTVSGAVTAGITVSLTGAATDSTSTDGGGNYAFAGLANGSYTVTPSKSGFTFSPASLSVTIDGASVAGQNFAAANAIACPNGQTNCSSTCVDLQKDPSNCGACGKACPAGNVCSAGACQVACASGLTLCGSSCVSVTSDAQNCGSCGNTCASGSVCTSGSCVQEACAPGLTNCGSNCVDTRSDGQNCGACGTVCQSGSVCSGGNCATICSSGQTNCSGSCVTLASDDSNCGACGQACAAGQLCANGECVAACAEGQTSCTGACVDTQTDVQNCGKCGNACAANESCVSGVCKAAGLDPAFAGAWTGTTTVAGPIFSGGGGPATGQNATFSYSTHLTLIVNGSSATVSGLCPDGNGTITVQGSGESASWSGFLPNVTPGESESPPPGVSLRCFGTIPGAPPCLNELDLQSIEMTLNDSGQLVTEGKGLLGPSTNPECEIVQPATVSFVGMH